MLKLTEQAVSDLQEIAEYTTATWGSRQRDIYMHMMESCFDKLSVFPHLGVSADYIFDGCRKYPAGKHLILYRFISEAGIEVITIVSQNMDIEVMF